MSNACAPIPLQWKPGPIFAFRSVIRSVKLAKIGRGDEASCLGMQVQCIIHVIFVIGAVDSQDTTVDDVISCESAAQLKA